jgi:acyl-CoA thioester hydrolase
MASHRHQIRVYYEDTDFSGLVYHASYLRFMERGRTELLRALGVNQSDVHDGDALAFVVRHMVIDFIKPARMDDLIEVETEVRDLAGASLIMAQQIWRGETRLISAEVKIAVVKGGKIARLPASLRAALT